jgi:hypothetical protein
MVYDLFSPFPNVRVVGISEVTGDKSWQEVPDVLLREYTVVAMLPAAWTSDKEAVERFLEWVEAQLTNLTIGTERRGQHILIILLPKLAPVEEVIPRNRIKSRQSLGHDPALIPTVEPRTYQVWSIPALDTEPERRIDLLVKVQQHTHVGINVRVVSVIHWGHHATLNAAVWKEICEHGELVQPVRLALATIDDLAADPVQIGTLT